MPPSLLVDLPPVFDKSVALVSSLSTFKVRPTLFLCQAGKQLQFHYLTGHPSSSYGANSLWVPFCMGQVRAQQGRRHDLLSILGCQV